LREILITSENNWCAYRIIMNN